MLSSFCVSSGLRLDNQAGQEDTGGDENVGDQEGGSNRRGGWGEQEYV